MQWTNNDTTEKDKNISSIVGPRAPVICTGFPQPPPPSRQYSNSSSQHMAQAILPSQLRQAYFAVTDGSSKRQEFTHVCLTASTQVKLTFSRDIAGVYVRLGYSLRRERKHITLEITSFPALVQYKHCLYVHFPI